MTSSLVKFQLSSAHWQAAGTLVEYSCHPMPYEHLGGSCCVDPGLLPSAKTDGRGDVGSVCSSARTFGGEEVCTYKLDPDSKFTCR